MPFIREQLFAEQVAGTGLTPEQTIKIAKIDPNETAIASIIKNNSNATQPATIYPYMWWADTTSGLLKIRNKDNNAWVSVLTLLTGVPVKPLTDDQIATLALVSGKADTSHTHGTSGIDANAITETKLTEAIRNKLAAIAGKADTSHTHGTSGIDANAITLPKIAKQDEKKIITFNANRSAIAVILNKALVGLSDVDNVSDADKPISNATQTALNLITGAGTGTGLTPAQIDILDKADTILTGTPTYMVQYDSNRNLVEIPMPQNLGGGSYTEKSLITITTSGVSQTVTIPVANRDNYDMYHFIFTPYSMGGIFTKETLKRTGELSVAIGYSKRGLIITRDFEGEKLTSLYINGAYENLKAIIGIKTGSGTGLTQANIDTLNKVVPNETAIANITQLTDNSVGLNQIKHQPLNESKVLSFIADGTPYFNYVQHLLAVGSLNEDKLSTSVKTKLANIAINTANIATNNQHTNNIIETVVVPPYCNHHGNFTTQQTCEGQSLTTWIPKQNGIDAHCVFHGGKDRAACIADPLYTLIPKNGNVPEHCTYKSTFNSEIICNNQNGFSWMQPHNVYNLLNKVVNLDNVADNIKNPIAQVVLNTATIAAQQIDIAKTDVFIKSFATKSIMLEAEAGDFAAHEGWERNSDTKIVLTTYKNLAVFIIPDNDTNIYFARIPITLDDFKDIHLKGGSFGGTSVLDEVNGSAGFYAMFECVNSDEILNANGTVAFTPTIVAGATTPTTAAIAENKIRRLTIRFIQNGDKLAVSAYEGLSSIVLDGSDITIDDWNGISSTHPKPNIGKSDFFTYRIDVKNGLNNTMFLYVNDILVSRASTFYLFPLVNSNGNELLYTSGGSSGRDRISYIRKFGATINLELPTVSISKNNLETKLRAILIIPKGTMDYEIILDRNIRLNVGYTIDIMSQNNGKISWKPNEATGAPIGLNTIINNYSTGNLKTINMQNRTLTNVLKDGAQFKVYTAYIPTT